MEVNFHPWGCRYPREEGTCDHATCENCNHQVRDGSLLLDLGLCKPLLFLCSFASYVERRTRCTKHMHCTTTGRTASELLHCVHAISLSLMGLLGVSEGFDGAPGRERGLPSYSQRYPALSAAGTSAPAATSTASLLQLLLLKPTKKLKGSGRRLKARGRLPTAWTTSPSWASARPAPGWAGYARCQQTKPFAFFQQTIFLVFPNGLHSSSGIY